MIIVVLTASFQSPTASFIFTATPTGAYEGGRELAGLPLRFGTGELAGRGGGEAGSLPAHFPAHLQIEKKKR